MCSSSLNPCSKKKHIQVIIDSPQLGHCNPKIRLPDTQRAHFLNINSWKTVSFHDFHQRAKLALLGQELGFDFLMMVQVFQGYFRNICILYSCKRIEKYVYSYISNIWYSHLEMQAFGIFGYFSSIKHGERTLKSHILKRRCLMSSRSPRTLFCSLHVLTIKSLVNCQVGIC